MLTSACPAAGLAPALAAVAVLIAAAATATGAAGQQLPQP